MSVDSKCMGAGLLLNQNHLNDLLRAETAAEWVEITSEHLIGIKANGYRPRITKKIESLLALYPVTLHGLELSIGSTDPLDETYLQNLREIERIVKPKIVSDHMVWTGALGYRAHELLPFPYTDEALSHVSQRVSAVQDYLGRQIVLENPPSSIVYTHSTYQEADFMNQLARRTGCGVLIDICNLLVSSTNNGLSAMAFIDAIEPSHVLQFHLAGYDVDSQNGFLYDTHDRVIPDPVWALYAAALDKIGPRSSNIEWIGNVRFGDLNNECQKIRAALRNTSRDSSGPERRTNAA